MLRGVDVSTFQGKIDWEKAKNHIDFAILRCGFGSDITSQDDSQFKRNADECTRLGIPFSVYLYSYANTKEKAKSEAEHVLRLVKGYDLSYPIFYDLEDAGTTQKCSKELIGDMAEIFCNAIKKAGYKVGIYANKYWFENILTDARFNKWDRWVAQYNSTLTYKGAYTMWQFSSTGSIDGVKGHVDMNYCYVDYVGNKKAELVKPAPSKENAKTTFIKAVQKACGAKVDGIAGSETISKTVTVSAKINSTHGVVKAIQTYLNHLGYDCGKVDGIAGVKFTAAVKKYQKANDCIVDGEITSREKTWRKLLGML